MKKVCIYGAFVGWIFLISTFWQIPVFCEEINKVIAIINDEVVTSKDLDEYCRLLKYRNPEFEITPQMKKNILEKLINDRLIVSFAKKKKIEVPKGWLKKKMDEIISSYPSYDAFYQSLTKEGINVTILKKRLQEQYLIQRMIEENVRSKIEISPKEITEYYKKNKDKFFSSKRYIVWIGRWSDREKRDEILSKIQRDDIDKKAWEELGMLKFDFTVDELKENIKEAILNLKEKILTKKDIDGEYYILYLEKVVLPQQLSLEQAKEKIYSIIWEEKFNRKLKEWLDELRKQAVIKIYEHN